MDGGILNASTLEVDFSKYDVDALERARSRILYSLKNSCVLDQLVQGNVHEVVVTHKDRLCRFGYDLLQWLFEKFNCKIVVLNEITDTSPEIELSEDVLSVINYFTAKHNGMRSAQNRKKRNAQSSKDQVVSHDTGKEKVETVVRSESMDV